MPGLRPVSVEQESQARRQSWPSRSHRPLLAAPQDATKPAEPPAVKPSLRSRPLSQPPIIDGVLDDDAWREGPVETGEWLSYNPLYGSTVPQKTKVWLGHDTNYLYFAFQCEDPDPSAIKTSITRRDNIWSDDWVGISLDALGTGQISYHLMVNPNGVQLDMLNTVSGGEDQARGLRVGQRRPQERARLRRRDARAACRRFASRAALTCTWGFCSGAG